MKYPNHIQKNDKQNFILYGNRGMDLEEEINLSNEFYIEQDKAYIYKKPTPIGIAQVSYNNYGKTIEKGYFKEQSTLDYNGLYRGKYIEFEAKVTKNNSSFPLANIHEHQIKHIRNIIRHQGIVFLIIKMRNIVYLIPGMNLLEFIDQNTRKSIPYEWVTQYGYVIKYGYRPLLDYLKIVDEVYFKEEM